jgi:hypothetical protein
MGKVWRVVRMGEVRARGRMERRRMLEEDFMFAELLVSGGRIDEEEEEDVLLGFERRDRLIERVSDFRGWLSE